MTAQNGAPVAITRIQLAGNQRGRHLSAIWIRWRRRRRDEFLRGGMPYEVAHRLTTEEAHARRSLVRQIGRKRAESTPLQVRFTNDGGALFAIVSDPSIEWGETL